MSEDSYKLSPFYGRKIIFEIFFLLQRMEGLNVPVDYAVLSFASKNADEKLGACAALEDLRNVRSCLRMLALSFLDIRVLLLHFIGLSRFLCYAF